MLWHSEAKPCWNSMRHLIDSAEWRSLKNKWPEFGKNGRNVWLGIAPDGFNPSATQSSNYSCWPVYTVPYNLTPFIMYEVRVSNVMLVNSWTKSL